MGDQNKKLEYLLGGVCTDSDVIFDALNSEHFDTAVGVLKSYIDNLAEHYDELMEEAGDDFTRH